jgi:hypothetical protein
MSDKHNSVFGLMPSMSGSWLWEEPKRAGAPEGARRPDSARRRKADRPVRPDPAPMHSIIWDVLFGRERRHG